MDIIPGLPDDVGLDCLVRVPHQYFPTVAAVCRSWNRQIRLPEFWARRSVSGSTRELVVMAQARDEPARDVGSEKIAAGAAPIYRLTVFESASGYRSELPEVPGWADGLPMFCRVVAVGRRLVVIGGWNPATGEVSRGVFVYDFVSAAWRRGADMPGCRRSFFACASDSNQMVYVAGGHDGDKHALRSALAYDVGEDEWSVMPQMATERDEANGMFHAGRFHVIGGYETSAQGGFVASAESFDVSTWQWGPTENDFLDSARCPKNCVGNGDGELFMCRGNDVACRQGSSRWRTVAELPVEVHNTVSFVTAWQGKVLVIGSESPCKSYVLNLKEKKWEKLGAKEEFSGHVQSGCCLKM